MCDYQTKEMVITFFFFYCRAAEVDLDNEHPSLHCQNNNMVTLTRNMKKYSLKISINIAVQPGKGPNMSLTDAFLV